MLGKVAKSEIRKRVHKRIRRKVSGTTDRPRLAVYRSTAHIYAQVIDDSQGRTLASASTLDPELKNEVEGKNKTAHSELVGSLVAQRALSHGIAHGEQQGPLLPLS